MSYLGFNSYYAFRTRYAVMRTANFSGRSVQIVVGYRNLDELSEKLKKAFSYRVLKDECLDLPKKTFMKREVIVNTRTNQSIFTNAEVSSRSN